MRERKKKHDDAHFPLGGRGKRHRFKYSAPPAARLVMPTPFEERCRWMNPPCNAKATIRVPRAQTQLCDDHYALNILRFGCDLEGEKIAVNGSAGNTP